MLIKKLGKLGLSDSAITWVTSYLSGRSQKVEINGTQSDSCKLEALSVFQGIILGPICKWDDLFLRSSTLLVEIKE